ncbi:MAG: PqqD family peptide modification chaperone [Rhodobacteraceae bacterium]|nr:PqqD family peptide modification chaperone [Paracoccaceae bacterium]
MTAVVFVRFDGLAAPVELRGCPEVVETLKAIAPGWPFAVVPACADPPFITMAPRDDAMVQVSLPSGPTKRLDRVNAVCELIATMAQELVRSQPHLLCLHAAAVEFGGRLVVFPNARRAGKSTLAACLASRGFRVFTDDYLPIEAADDGRIVGRATGVQTRLRLPLPSEFSAGLRGALEARFGERNAQYVFMNAPNPVLHGETAPIGAVVFLERAATAAQELRPARPSDAINRLLKQNFARGMHSAEILGALSAISQSAMLYHLRYATAERAADALAAAMEAHTDAPPPRYDFGARPAEVAGPVLANRRADPEARYARAAGFREILSDDQCFLADAHGTAVHRLNAGAIAIWRLLEEPMSAREIAEAIHAQFPAVPSQSVLDDTVALLDGFLRNRLVVSASD